MQHDRVLLIQAGHLVGVGLVHMACYLRRNGVEAHVMGYRHPNYEIWGKEVTDLLAVLKPTLVAIGFKWYHEVIGALWLAELVKQTDPSIVTVMGGNSAAGYYRELLGFGHIDFVVRGDGEVPLLDICRGVAQPANTAFRSSNGEIQFGQVTYVQRGSTDEGIYISELESIFPSKSDLVTVPNFVVGGKGCAQACLYCSGGRDKQRELFGRKGPHLRPASDVRRDVTALYPYVAGFFFDFSSEHAKKVSLVDWFKEVFADVDCKRHRLSFLPWELPDDAILEYLTSTFGQVDVGLDIGTLSERHRNYLASRGFFKRYLVTKNICNQDFLDWADRHRHVRNLSMALTAISGMPFVEPGDFSLERSFAEQILKRDNLTLGYEGHRLHFEPGSPVAENPEKFEMESPIRTFRDLVSWFEEGGDLNSTSMRFKSKELERQVERHAKRMHRLANSANNIRFAKKYQLPKSPLEFISRTFIGRGELMSLRLKRGYLRQFSFTRNDWLGARGRGRPGAPDCQVQFVKNSAGAGWVVNEDFYQRPLPVLAGRPHEQRDYGRIGGALLDRFASGERVSDVVQEFSAAEAMSPSHLLTFIENSMARTLLSPCNG